MNPPPPAAEALGTLAGATALPPAGFARRWWTYQRERFPVVAHGVLIAAFSFSAVSYSALVRGAAGGVVWPAVLVAFGNSFLAFLQLRLADEFKDAQEDRLYRPYRPVPRGLVTLRSLGILGGLTGVVQLALALWLDARLVWPLLLTWTYLALMSREFFAREWLKARPITYMWTHMLIMPLIDFYAAACDWLPAGLSAPLAGLAAFLAVSFCNGLVIELGRKLRAPAQEEPGVNTYTALWGLRTAVGVWWGALAATAVMATLAAGAIHFRTPVMAVLGILLAVAAWLGGSFLNKPTPGGARGFEVFSGIWTLAMYLSLGAVPLAFGAIMRH